MSKRRKPVSSEPCIYCGSVKPRRSREHVIPRAFGTFEHNWTLTCVCGECNQFFGRELEPALAYDSAEALFRLEGGVRPPAAAAQLGNRRIKSWLKEPGAFHNVRIEFKPTKDGQVMEPVPPPQIALRREGEGEWLSILEAELNPETVPKMPENYEIRITSPRDALPRLQAKMAKLGLVFAETDRVLDQPITDSKTIQIEHEFFVDSTIARGVAKIAFNYSAKLLGGATILDSAFDAVRRFVRHGEGEMSMVSIRRAPVVVPLAGQILKGHGCALGWVAQPPGLVALASPFNELTYGVVLSRVESAAWSSINSCHFFDLDQRQIIEVPHAM